MARLNINIGTTANDKTGDPLRTAFDKVNQNFVELYAHVGADTQIPSQSGNNGKYLTTNGTTLSWSTVTVPTLTSELTNDSNFVVKDTPPTTLQGASGDVAGLVAFDNNYIYYCTDNYVSAGGGGGASVTLVPNQLGQTVNSLSIDKAGPSNTDWAVPQVGWTLTVNSTTVIIEEITSDASFVYMTLSGFVSLPMTGNITLEEGGGVQPDIWVRQKWGVEDISDLTDITNLLSNATDRLTNSTYDVTLDANGNTTFPSQGYTRQNNSFTRTVNGNTITSTPAVIWTGTSTNITGAKLTIQIEGNETGDPSGWHTQVCEAIISDRYYGNAGNIDPQMTVYGIIHTSAEPLATFTVQRNPSTNLIEVVGTITATATGTLYPKVHSVELGTRD